MTTSTRPRASRRAATSRSSRTRSTNTSALRAPIPATWQPTPPELRGTLPAPCTRCDRIVRLPLGPGEALCDPCAAAEETALVHDKIRRTWGIR